MRNDKWLALVSMFLATATGCAASDDDGPTDSAAVTESSGDATATASATDGMTGMVSVSASASATDSATDDTATAGTEESTGEPVVPMPNGAMCDDNAGCESGFCYYISVLGGICGECNADTDCPSGGCSLPNPLAQPPVGAHCNMGEPGAGCMSDDICQDGYQCATILEVPGILEAATCSECLTDADCTDGQLCSPTYDILNISGQKMCVDPGTVENGQGCDHLGTGNDACASGLCATVDIMGLLQVGVCGDCSVDVDCTPPDVCLPADIDIATGAVTPPTCGPAA